MPNLLKSRTLFCSVFLPTSFNMLSTQLKIVRQTRRQKTLLWKQSLDNRLLHQANILALNQTIRQLWFVVSSTLTSMSPALVLGMSCIVDAFSGIPSQFNNDTVILSLLNLIVSYSVVTGTILSKYIKSKQEARPTDICPPPSQPFQPPLPSTFALALKC